MNNLSAFVTNLPYIAPFIMLSVGIYLILLDKNLIKKVVGLNLFQGGIIVFYILIAKINKGLPPIDGINIPNEIYSNPLPHVLMLTAIVVGIATTSLACALIYQIYRNYGTINEEELIKINNSEQN
jgi:multicomponent Na+:H+ antiporter subunit C